MKVKLCKEEDPQFQKRGNTSGELDTFTMTCYVSTDNVPCQRDSHRSSRSFLPDTEETRTFSYWHIMSMEI